MLHPPDKGKKAAAVLALLLDEFAALLITLGMTLGLMKSILGMYPVRIVLLFIATGILLSFVTGLLPRFRWLIRFLFVLSQGVLYFEGEGCFFAFRLLFRAVILTGDGCSLLPYTDVLCAFSGFAVALIIAGLVREKMGISCMLLCMTALCLASYLKQDGQSILLYVLLCAGGLALLLCRTADSVRLSSVPLIALLLAAALYLTPEGLVWDKAQKGKELIQQTIHDYLLFNTDRQSFSLADQGYMPLANRIGGAAEPSENVVLLVQSDENVYLRAVSKDAFSGLNWYDTLGIHRYLYISDRYLALRRETFDMIRPLCENTKQESTIAVTVMAPAASTLYVPQRVTGFTSQSKRMVPYWNEAGEMFITRDLETGDQYTVTCVPYAAGDAETEMLIARCASLEDSHYAEVAAAYLSVPAHTQQEIYAIAAAAAGYADTPYEKAMRIASYLKKNYSYELNIAEPPENVDACAWFLLREKKGYCTYFATAMTLLCRMNGIPARYVTGYVARPQNGEACVTGADAHAWTEIYLNGFGWLTVDATAATDDGDQDTHDDQQDRKPENPLQDPTPGAVTPSPDVAGRNTPSPTAVPDETENRENENNRAQETPESAGSSPSPEPDSQTTPSPAPDTESNDGENEERSPERTFLAGLLFIMILILILTVCIRLYVTEPHRMAARHPERAFTVWSRAVLGALGVLGFRLRTGETLSELALRAAQNRDDRTDGIAQAFEVINACVYGSRSVDLSPVENCYENLYAGMGWRKRIRMVLGRLRLTHK